VSHEAVHHQLVALTDPRDHRVRLTVPGQNPDVEVVGVVEDPDLCLFRGGHPLEGLPLPESSGRTGAPPRLLLQAPVEVDRAEVAFQPHGPHRRPLGLDLERWRWLLLAADEQCQQGYDHGVTSSRDGFERLGRMAVSGPRHHVGRLARSRILYRAGGARAS